MWTQIEYKVKKWDKLLDLQKSKQELANETFFQLKKINDFQVLLLTASRSFVYSFTDQVFTQLDLTIPSEIDLQGYNQLLVLDVSNFNLGIFQYLVIKDSEILFLLDV